MPRRRKKSTKRGLTMGIALEVATLVAIILLARPDWIVAGFELAEQYRDDAQTLTPEVDKHNASPSSQVITDLSSEAAGTQQGPNSPAEVIPAGDWLPGYFDVVDTQVPNRPAVYISPHFAGPPPKTAFLPWPILPSQHF